MLKTGMIVVLLAGSAAGTYLSVSGHDDGNNAVPAMVDIEKATPRSVEIDPPQTANEKPRQLDPAYLMSLAVSTEEAKRLAPTESCSAPSGCELPATAPAAKPDP